MNDSKEFAIRRQAEIKSMSSDVSFKKKAVDFFVDSTKFNYSYHFEWLGVPIIQYPQDIVAMQELIWNIKPDLIIETGVARGGSLIFYSSMLQLLGNGEVLGIDIDIRDHNRKVIESHPMSKRVSMIQGSSVAGTTIEKVKKIVAGKKVILVVLDSNHTHEHVLEELKLYSPFVSVNSYLVVFDTVVDDLPAESVKDRPWGKGNNPKTAVREFLRTHSEFMIDKSIPDKLLLTVAPDGYLRRVR